MIAPLPDAAAARSLARLRPAIAEDAHRLLERGDAVGFLARLDLWFADVHVPISELYGCLLYTSPSPRDLSTSRMPSSA